MIQEPQELMEIIKTEPAVLIYFSHAACNVCKVLKPKIKSLLEEDFDQIKMVYVDTVLHPEIPAQMSIFTVPTIVVFLEGKVYFKWSRNISIQQIKRELGRPYQMLFS